MATAEEVQVEKRPSGPGTRTKWLAPLASGGLFYLAFFPVAFAPLAWVAAVPLLCLVRLPGRPGRRYLAAYLGGLAFYLPALQWFRVADPRMYVTWIALAVYISVYWPIAVALLRLLERRTRLPLVVTFPVVWVSLDYLRWGLWGSFTSILTGSHQHDVPGGFSWYYLGHSQHDFLELIQVADLTGVYGVTFVIAAVNALLFEILFTRDPIRALLGSEPVPPRATRRGLLLQGLAVGGLLLACLGYGLGRLGQGAGVPGPRVAFLQGFVDQKVRNAAYSADANERKEARRSMGAHYMDLARRAARLHPDLMVWPETSFPAAWVDLERGRPSAQSRDLADDVIVRFGTPQLLGLTADTATPGARPRTYNSAVLIGPDPANGHFLGRYDKIHRVPFGEYIPLGGAVAWLDRLGLFDEGSYIRPGEEFTRFALPGPPDYRFGVVICYEDTDPAMARPYVEPPPRPVDFLLNISNDAWFDGTSEHDQHLAICRFRAVECRRAIGRAVNMGISAVIDSSGRVLAPTAEWLGPHHLWAIPDDAGSLPVSRWHEFKKQSGVLIGRLPVDTRESLYARIGDAFALGCLGLLTLTLIGLALRRQVGVK